jgi:hypothetical protein
MPGIVPQPPGVAVSQLKGRGGSITRPMNESPLARQFQLCFRPLTDSGRGFRFPCDARGRVDLDRLSERLRNDYFYARAMIGRELAVPAVETRH